MKKFRVFLALLLSALMLFGMAPLALAEETTEEPAAVEPLDFSEDMTGQLVIIHTNDSHARVDDNMGFSSVAALKAAYKKAGATVLLLDAGDTLHGKPMFNLSKGESAVEILNAAGYDAMAPGNHDFHYGAAQLKKLSAKMDFPLLAANVTRKGAAYFKTNVVIERDGLKIGIFGLATPETAYKTNPLNVEGLKFEAPIATARKQVRELQKKDVDYIIALCHLGLEGEYTTEKLAKAITGIDVIIDGHSHSVLEEGLVVKGTLIASTGEYIEKIGVVTITADGKASAQLVSAEQFSGKDAAVDKLINGLKKKTDDLLNVVVGSTSVDLDGERENVRTRETNLGNLIADAMLDATGADVAMNNGGGIRMTIPQGKITKAQILEVLPFSNYVVLKEVSGKDILTIMEMGIALYPEAAGGFPQVAGIRFEYDSSRAAGKRIVNAWIGGEKLVAAKKYTFATNDFLAAGGDGYDMLAKAKTLGEYSTLEDIVMDFLADNPDYVAQVEGRTINLNEAGQATEAAA